jgi:hypothetical protein
MLREGVIVFRGSLNPGGKVCWCFSSSARLGTDFIPLSAVLEEQTISFKILSELGRALMFSEGILYARRADRRGR